MHVFVRKEGESVDRKKRVEHRHTVKIGDDVMEALRVASSAMLWSQTEVVEYLMREHLVDLMTRVTRDVHHESSSHEALRRLLASSEGDREREDDDEEQWDEDDGGDESSGLLSRLWKRLTSG